MKPLQKDACVAAGNGWLRGLLWMWMGLCVTSSFAQVSLIPAGSVWKYRDDGTDQAAAWRALNFDDSQWASGPAQLGYGDGDEATVVGFGPNLNAKFITTYFRRKFVMSGLRSFSNVVVRLLRDDGGIVYLNGQEVFRSNMPTGTVNHLTLASSAATGSDESNNFYARALSPSLLLPGSNILAVEIHQNTNNSTDLSFNLELVGSFTNLPPTVSLTQPTDGEQVPAGTHRLVAASVADTDGVVVGADFFVDGVLRWRDTNAPFEFLLSDIPPGSHTLTVSAFDNGGASAASAPVHLRAVSDPSLSVLVPNGAVWKYFDQGIDLGRGWQAPFFDDNLWPSGPAELGFGDSLDALPRPERTGVNQAGRQYFTTYFRHAFFVADPGIYLNLILRLLRDDGGVVYLNGVEVFRSNMDPSIPILFNTPASQALDDGTNYFPTGLPPFSLRAGTNVLAVEIHQNALSSTDLSFDLMLLAVPNGSVPAVSPLPNQLVALGGILHLHADAKGDPPPTFQWQREGVNILDEPPRISGAQSPDLIIQPALTQDSGEYTIVVSNQFGVAAVQANVRVVGVPEITVQPISQTAPFCSQVTFTAAATEFPTWQWFRNGVLLPGATAATLVLTNVQRPEVGLYVAVASNPAGSVQSAPGELQILLTKEGVVTNKLVALNRLTSLPPGFRGFVPQAGIGGLSAALPLLHGVPLLFTTYGATKDAGEPNHCGVAGGHSKWANYLATQFEPLRVSTEGSSFDTVLAAYRWLGGDYSTLTLLTCTNDSLGQLTSVIRFPVLAALKYHFAVDGVGGATGTVRLVVGEGTLHSPKITTNGLFQFGMTGHGGRAYRLQTSAVLTPDAASWTTVLQTNVPPNVSDWVLLYQTNITAGFPLRFYRGFEE